MIQLIYIENNFIININIKIVNVKDLLFEIEHLAVWDGKLLEVITDGNGVIIINP